MDIQFSPELESKLHQIAAERKQNAASLVCEVVERALDYDTWFARQVAEGIESADREDLIEHAEVGRMLERRYTE